VVAPVMIYVSNEDKPGFIGRFASLLGNAAINIATFALGRDREGRVSRDQDCISRAARLAVHRDDSEAVRVDVFDLKRHAIALGAGDENSGVQRGAMRNRLVGRD